MHSSLAVLALGFVLGVRHASDPDHVVAVTAITARDRRIAPAALVGAVNVFGKGGFVRPAPSDARTTSWRAFGLGPVRVLGARWPGLGAPHWTPR